MALNINGTTGISGVDGSVSAPAVTGTDSNTGITFPSADTIKFSTGGVERMSITNSGVIGVGGKALQVVQNQYSTQTSVNSTSYVDTGLTATITPSSSSSKVLVMAWLHVTTSLFASPYNVYGWGFNLVRGSTEIKTGDTGQYYQSIADNDISYTVFNQPHIAIYLDTPNTTSSTTYKIQGKESDVNANLTINASSQKSEMILIEVAA